MSKVFRCSFALMQHYNRSIPEAIHFLTLAACATDCRTCCNNSLLHIFRCSRHFLIWNVL